MYPHLPGMQNRATDTSLPTMELLCRIGGFGATAEPPAWSKFCSPPEGEILKRLLELGRIRRDINGYLTKSERLAARGHYAVASVVSSVRETVRIFDVAIVTLSGKIQTGSPPTLNYIFSVVSEYEGSLLACFGYLRWLVEEVKEDELFTGRLLDESFQRFDSSHNSARRANEAIFEALFRAFKRTVMPWLAFGFLDSRTEDFFIKEPTDCRIYFREIGALIANPLKAPGHFSASLVEKIAQFGYIRKFLGWRTKNILGDPVLEDQIVALSDRLRNLHWKEYRTAALEDVVDSFGEIYSHALYVSIFQKCKVRQILFSFQQMYLMAFVDMFDDFVFLAEGSLRKPWTKQKNAVHEANVKLDLAFEGTMCTRKYDPQIQTGGTALNAENIADRVYSGFYFVIKESNAADTKPLWESLELEFSVCHPLDWFFHPRAMAKYKQIFRFLLRLKRLSHAFNNLWRTLREGAISGRLSEGDHEDLYRWQYTFTHVISALQSFIQVDVIDQAWLELQQKLNRLNDYVQLMEAHDAFLMRISMHAMIDNPPLYKCMKNMVQTGQEVVEGICDQLERPAHEAINLEDVRGKILDLNSILKVFVRLVHSQTDQKDSLPASLALKLDFSANFTHVLGRFSENGFQWL